MPSLWHALRHGVRRLVRRRADADELDDEIKAYLEAATEHHRARGLSAEEAARAARIEMGSSAAVKDEVRASRWESVIDNIWRDAKYAARRLRRTPAFTLAAIAVLAIGIGANTAIFSLVNALLLRPLPVPAPEEVVFIRKAGADFTCCTRPEFDAYAKNAELFSGVAFVGGTTRTLGSGEQGTDVYVESTSSNYFDALRVKPQRGRGFSSSDNASSAAPVVVISDRLWRTRFHGRPETLGTSIALGSEGRADSGWRYTIVGIMGAEFTGIADPWRQTDIWMLRDQSLQEFDYGVIGLSSTTPSVPTVVARRRPGVSLERIQAFVDVTRAAFPDRVRYANPADGRSIVGTSPSLRLPMDPAGRIAPSRLAAALMALAGVLLVLSMINLTGVTLARGLLRRPELAVRMSLGATRARVARQLTLEGVFLSGLGGLGGLWLSRGLVTAFLATLPDRSFTAAYASMDVPIDMRVLVFAAAVALLTGLVIGLLPLRHVTRFNLLASLGHSGDASPERSRSSLRRWIVIPQVALCVGLVLGAGTAMRALMKVAAIGPGYEPRHVGAVQWTARRFRYSARASSAENQAYSAADSERQRRFNARVLELAAATPGLRAAAITDGPPTLGIGGRVMTPEALADGQPTFEVASSQITDGYFEAIGLKVIRGRGFDERDTSDSPKVVVVSESVAAQLWPGRSGVGRRLTAMPGTRNPEWLEVVGVVNDVRLPLSEGRVQPTIYFKFGQEATGAWRSRNMLVARGDMGDDALLATLRRIVWQADPEMDIRRSQTLSAAIAEVRYPRTLAVSLLGSSALAALLLAGLGLYAIVSHSVAQRRRELAIRSALGAARTELITLVLREGLIVAVIGCVIGAALAEAGMRIVASRVFAVPAVDAVTAIGVMAVVTTVVLAASILPARRAGRVDPIAILRQP